MKLKPLLSAVVILAALALVAYLLQRAPAPAPPDARVGRPVLDPAVVERAARIELADQGKRVEIARQGGAWLVSSYFDLPADLTKLSQLVDDLSRAKIDRLVTRDPARLDRLGFKDTAVTLVDGAGRPVWKLTLGKDADSGGRFLRFGDEPRGYLASLAVFLDTEPKGWADSQLVSLKPDDITAVELTFADGTSVSVSRAKPADPWRADKTPAGMRLKDDRINSLLSPFANLRFEDTADPTAPDVTAARAHARNVRITTFAHQTFTIALGRRPAGQPEAQGTEGQRTEAQGTGTPKPVAQKTGTEAQGTAVRGRDPAKGESPPAIAAASAPQPSTQNPEPKTQNPAPVALPPAQGPVYAFVTSSDPAAPVNAIMKRRAFQIYDWVLTSLPEKPDELFEAVPVPPPPVNVPPAPAKPAAPSPTALPKP